MINQTNSYNTLNQGVLPFFISDCLDICDPVFTFDGLVGGMNLMDREKSRYRLFEKITELLQEINSDLQWSGIKIETNTEYTTKLNEYVTKMI